MANAASLTIIQLNDNHAYFDVHQELFRQGDQGVYRREGGYDRMEALVTHMRETCGERLLFCSNTDTLGGTYPAVRAKGSAMVPNKPGFDTMTVHWGNAFGPLTLGKHVAQLNFPELAINAYDKTTNQLIFPPCSVKEIDRTRIGLIGIASNHVEDTMPASCHEGLHLTSGREELPGVIDRLRTFEQVDLIILVSHLGFPQDMKLLSQVQGVDLCLSVHTHNRFSQPVHQGNTLVIQSGCHGSFLGRIDLELKNGRITGYEHQLIEAESSAIPDLAVADIIKHVLSPVNAQLATVVGQTAEALSCTAAAETSADNCLVESLNEAAWGQTRFFKWLALPRQSRSLPAQAAYDN